MEAKRASVAIVENGDGRDVWLLKLQVGCFIVVSQIEQLDKEVLVWPFKVLRDDDSRRQ